MHQPLARVLFEEAEHRLRRVVRPLETGKSVDVDDDRAVAGDQQVDPEEVEAEGGAARAGR